MCYSESLLPDSIRNELNTIAVLPDSIRNELNTIAVQDSCEKAAEFAGSHPDLAIYLPLYASFQGGVRVIAWCAEHKINLDRGRSMFNNTALIKAVTSGNFEIVKALVEGGADIDAKGYNGDTALHRAADPRIFDLLVSRGANLDIPNYSGVTARESRGDLLPPPPDVKAAVV